MSPASSIVIPPFTKAVKWIIIVNVAVFFIQHIVGGYNPEILKFFFDYFALKNIIFNDFGAFLPWQPLTYMFIHGNFTHILLNMLFLWMFGSQYEQDFGSKRFLQLYFISGIGTGLIEMFFLNNVVGASAAVFGCLISYAYFRPNAVILVLLIIPMKIKYFVAALIAIETISMISVATGPVAVAHSAHLLGAALGFIFLQMIHGRYPFLNFIHEFYKKKKQERQKKTLRFDLKFNKDSNPGSQSESEKIINKDQWVQERVDALLDKVSKGGIGSLTKKEKEFLDKVSMDYQSKNNDENF